MKEYQEKVEKAMYELHEEITGNIYAKMDSLNEPINIEQCLATIGMESDNEMDFIHDHRFQTVNGCGQAINVDIKIIGRDGTITVKETESGHQFKMDTRYLTVTQAQILLSLIARLDFELGIFK